MNLGSKGSEHVMEALSRRFGAPKGLKQASPGQRPETRATTPSRALKGRHEPDRALGLCRPFRAISCGGRGVAPISPGAMPRAGLLQPLRGEEEHRPIPASEPS